MHLTTTLMVLAAAALAAGCGMDPPPPASEGGTGTVSLTLTSMSGSTTYALANATFLVERIQPPPTPGEITGVRLHGSDSAGTHLTATLDVGRYTVTLLDGWQIERAGSPTNLVPVHATLQSANPVTVSIFSGQTTTVTFQFQTNGIPLTFGPGTIDINVGVGTCDPMPPPGVELNVISNPDFEVNTDGWTRLTGLSDDPHCGLHSGKALDDSPSYVLPHPETLTTYTVSVWVKMSAPGGFTLSFGGRSSTGAASDRCKSEKATFGSVPSLVWTRLFATRSVGGPDCIDASIAIVSDNFGTELDIDDVYAIPQ